MKKMVGEKEAYENLANAIVLSAVRDYKNALIRLRKHPESEACQREVKRQEQFFYSPWYEMLTNLNPDYLSRKIKEMIDEKYEKMANDLAVKK